MMQTTNPATPRRIALLAALSMLGGLPACSADDPGQPGLDARDDAPDDTGDPARDSGDTPSDDGSGGGDVATDSGNDDTADAGADTAPDTDEPGSDTGTDSSPDTAEDADTTPPPIDPDRAILDGACDQASRAGGFKVEMNSDVGYTAIDGTVRDGIIPGNVADVTLVEDGCRLLKRRRLVCNPVCGPAEICNTESACVPSPLGQDVGTVTFAGLVQPVTIEALPPGNNYFFTRLRHPGFAPGDLIRLTSTDGFAGELELYGVGVDQVVPTDALLVLTAATPLEVHWTPPAPGARSRVVLELTIDQHGLTPVTAVCDFDDVGTARVPAGIVDGLIAAGVTGFPSGRVTRRTADSVMVDDLCVDFSVTSIRNLSLEVTGFVPCTSDANCPEGTTCQLAIQQCQ
jgi:Cys-rich repeat protein